MADSTGEGVKSSTTGEFVSLGGVADWSVPLGEATGLSVEASRGEGV